MKTIVLFALGLAFCALAGAGMAELPPVNAAPAQPHRAPKPPPPPQHVAAHIAIDLGLNPKQTAALAHVLSDRRSRMQAQRSERQRIDADTDKQLDAVLGGELAARVRDWLRAHRPPPPGAAGKRRPRGG